MKFLCTENREDTWFFYVLKQTTSKKKHRVGALGKLNTRITGAVTETYASTLTTTVTGAVTETYSSTQATTATGDIGTASTAATSATPDLWKIEMQNLLELPFQ